MNLHQSFHKRPFFTVIIPAYNRLDELSFTLKSLLEQTFEDFECIVVDDGSSDHGAFVSLVKSLNDGRFRLLAQKNAGGGAARNTGIMASRGKYIAFLDSDDTFHAKKLEKFVKYLESDSMKIYYSMAQVDRGVGKKWIRPNRSIRDGEDVGEYLFVENQFIQTSTIVLATEIAKSVLFDPNLRKGQDLDFCIRLDHAGFSFHMIEEPLVIWRDLSESNRTSRYQGFKAPMLWLEKSKHMLSKRAFYGYRVTVLFYYLAKHKPMLAVKYLITALIFGRVPLKILIRQMLRGWLPKKIYRFTANTFVKLFGTNHD